MKDRNNYAYVPYSGYKPKPAPWYETEGALWFFLVIFAPAGIVLLWLQNWYTPRGRAILSAFFAVFFILISWWVISAVTKAPDDDLNNMIVGIGTTPVPDQNQVPANSTAGTDGIQTNTAQYALEEYMTGWKNQDWNTMLSYASLEWINKQPSPTNSMNYIHSAKNLSNYTIESAPNVISETQQIIKVRALYLIAGVENDKYFDVTLTYEMDTKTGQYKWVLDPAAFKNPIDPGTTGTTSGDVLSPDTTGTISDDTNVVGASNTPGATTKVWYNENGGKYYHAIEQCSSINFDNPDKPVMIEVLWGVANEKGLKPCPVCNPPHF